MPPKEITEETDHAEPIQLSGPTEPPPMLTGPTVPPPPGPPSSKEDGSEKSKVYSDGKDRDKPEGKKDNKEKDKGSRGRLWRIGLIILAVLAVLLLIGLVPRLLRGPQIKKDTKQAKDTTPTVSETQVQTAAASDDLDLPGNIQAVQQTAIVARASGYVQRWYADIGDKVKAGQLLATISTPDVDQQVTQARAQVSQTQAAVQQAIANVNGQQANLAQSEANASRAEAQYQQARTDLARAQAALAQADEASAQQRAQLAQAQANLNLAQVTARRYQNLLFEGAIDQQTTDQAMASYETNQANVRALSASLRASLANVRAFSSAVGSSRANVKAYADGIRAGKAAVGAAAANVRSARAATAAAQANVRAAQANVARLASLQGFNRVTAPFSGVITARNVDAGAFISPSGGPLGGGSSVGDTSAGTSTQGAAASGNPLGGGSSPGGSGGQSGSLFSLAQTGALRVYVNIPQTYVGVVSAGQPVDLTVQELPGQKFKGSISRLAGALDPSSRTLVTEVRLGNPNGTLSPGMFAQVHLHVPHPPGAVLIPGGALVTNSGGTQVVTIDKNSKLHFQPITLGRDLGKTLEVTQGLSVGQQIVATPSDDLKDGQKVKVTQAPPSP